MAYDYRRARDWVYGIVREGEGEKVTDYVTTPASRSERALLLAMIEFAPNIAPSNAALAKMLVTDERTVRRLIAGCKKNGLLRVHLRTGQRSCYQLACDTPGNTPPGQHAPRATRPPTPGTMPADPGQHAPQSRQESRQESRQGSTSPSSAGSTAYQLTSPEADPEPQKGKSQKARSGQATKGNGKTAPAENGVEHQATIDHYHQVFLACRNVAPIIDSRVGSSVKSLLKKLKGNGPEARRRIDIAFASFRKSTVTIHVIAKDPDAFANLEAPRSNGRARPQQTTDADYDELTNRPQYRGVLS